MLNMYERKVYYYVKECVNGKKREMLYQSPTIILTYHFCNTLLFLLLFTCFVTWLLCYLFYICVIDWYQGGPTYILLKPIQCFFVNFVTLQDLLLKQYSRFLSDVFISQEYDVNIRCVESTYQSWYHYCSKVIILLRKFVEALILYDTRSCQ